MIRTKTLMSIREFETAIYEALEQTGMYIPIDAELYDVRLLETGIVIEFEHETTEED